MFRWRTSPPNRSLFYLNIQMSCGRISFCLPFFVQALNLHVTSLLFSRAEPGGRQAVRQNNGLELRIHKLKFVELLRAGERLAAVQYARQHFPTFVSGQEREVQSLMGVVMYSGPGLEQSPYAHLLSPSSASAWSPRSLWPSPRAAGAASPPQQQAGHAAETGSDATFVPGRNSLVHHFQVFAVWHSKDKLSIEIELGGDCRYHSVEPDQAVNLAWRAAVQQCSGQETHHSGVSFRPA